MDASRTSGSSRTPAGNVAHAPGSPLLLMRSDVERLLTLDECIAAVGADNEDKQEIDPFLLAHANVVVDLLDQCCAIGDLHHAIAAGLMAPSDVHAQLGEIVAGVKSGRSRADEIIVFDSSGTALQDVAAAAAAYRRALGQQQGVHFSFNA